MYLAPRKNRFAFSFRWLAFSTLAFGFAAGTLGAAEPVTQRKYLSGQGPKDAVPWEFSVTAGRRAGEQTTIPVPSQWEQHGFGTYNYGQEPTPKSTEHGLYRLRFNVPETWKGQRIRLVFEGVMTDATVKVNGRVAGPTHQGAFYRFHYDVTALVKLSAATDNLLEVDVAKVSANTDTEIAERGGDYWVFGGIFRPVWLEAAPAQSIENVAIDARADGSFLANVTLASVREATEVQAQIFGLDDKPLGAAFTTAVPAGGVGRVKLTAKFDAPRLWTAETPNLYTVRFTLRKGNETMHTTKERFGFRTFEVRAGQGLFLNGQRILLKGVDRHSFRPETGRTLSREDCYQDANLIRSMNMNAVRMSHYPPDEAFLEACDELGLYVLDELSGWHHAHDTDVGRQLIRAMVERDVNHPSILFWDNGNEGGFNRELDGEFALYDPQNRRVLHPWEVHDDVDTKHYPNYEDLVRRLQGPNILMPTEVLHALYDGGAGAGLEDYWNAIAKSPFGGGAFIWDFADEGIARTDQGGRLDVFSTYAPDGVVGPHLEKEGSYYAIRDLWCPVQVAAPVLDETFRGVLAVENRFDFTSLADCRFSWQLIRYRGPAGKVAVREVLAEAAIAPPSVGPHASGNLAIALPANWQEADALLLVAFGPGGPGETGSELWTWSWPTVASQRRHAALAAAPATATPKVEVGSGAVRLVAGDAAATFDATTGLLQTLRRGAQTLALTQGPQLAFARPAAAGPVEWLPFSSEDEATQTRRLATPRVASTVEVTLDYQRTDAFAGFQLEISPDGQVWKTIFEGTRRSGDGKNFNFSPQPVAAVRLSKVRRSDGNEMAVKLVRLGHAPARFFAGSAAPVVVTQGTERNAQTGATAAWMETHGAAGLDRARWTLRSDGSLRLDYAYTLSGDFLYHGITFSYPEEKMKSLLWLGAGPFRVWQNRLRGTWFGQHEVARDAFKWGPSWSSYPEFEGCFAGVRWATLETEDGALTVAPASPEVYLRVGTPPTNHQNTSVEFPAGNLSILHAIPAIGSKFVTPERSGPTGNPAKAAGSYSGSVVIDLGPAASAKK